MIRYEQLPSHCQWTILAFHLRTHCAGVISAVKNGKGIVGAFGGSSAIRIMALRFLSSEGGRTSDAVLALNYAVSMGAVISSNSWGWALIC